MFPNFKKSGVEFFRHLKESLKFSFNKKDDVIDKQLKILETIEEYTLLSRDVCKIISGYEMDPNTDSYEAIQYEHLPKLNNKLENLQNKLKDTSSLKQEITTKIQLTTDMIILYKNCQSSIKKERQQKGWTIKDWQSSTNVYLETANFISHLGGLR